MGAPTQENTADPSPSGPQGKRQGRDNRPPFNWRGIAVALAAVTLGYDFLKWNTLDWPVRLALLAIGFVAAAYGGSVLYGML